MTQHTGYTADHPQTTAHQVPTARTTADHVHTLPKDFQNIIYTIEDHAVPDHTPIREPKNHTLVEQEGPYRRTSFGLLQFRWQFHQLRTRIRVFKLMKPYPGSSPYEQGGPSSNKHVTVALITDYPTITVHAGKWYKALIDSGAAISLVRYSTYQSMDNSLKTNIHSTLTIIINNNNKLGTWYSTL